MEKRYLQLISVTAVLLTLGMFAYTMSAALSGDRSTKAKGSPSSVSSNSSTSSNSNSNSTANPNAKSGPNSNSNSSTITTNTNTQNTNTDPESAKLFPPKLAGMDRLEIIGGEQAIASVSQLHGKDIAADKAYVVKYQGSGNNELTIWISESSNKEEAARLFKVMDEKVPKSVFQNYKKVILQGKEYIYVTGMGQEHYYWLSGNRVIWLAVNSANSAEIVTEAASLW